jgi:hypothetical protein
MQRLNELEARTLLELEEERRLRAELRKCSKCGQPRPPLARLYCAECKGAVRRENGRGVYEKQRDPERRKEQRRKWYAKHRKNNPEWREQNKQRAKAWRKKRRM